MSGGSYDYLYSAMWNDKPLQEIFPRVKDMSMDMRAEGLNDPADELDKLALDMEMYYRMIKVRFGRLEDVMQSWEWYKSCDTSKESFVKSWEKFLEGKK